MSTSEIKLFEKYLKKSKKYFEFGTGGSTYLAATFDNIEVMESVESDNEWIIKLSKEQIISDRLDNKTLKINFIDINAKPGKRYGKPHDKSKIANWPLYPRSILTCNFEPDIILVDGRFRVAAALESYKKLNDNGFLLFHDYKPRQHYHVIEEFYDKVEDKKKLQVFKKKEKINISNLEKIINKNLFNPK